MIGGSHTHTLVREEEKEEEGDGFVYVLVDDVDYPSRNVMDTIRSAVGARATLPKNRPANLPRRQLVVRRRRRRPCGSDGGGGGEKNLFFRLVRRENCPFVSVVG